jgi:hypothetical protein
MENKKFQKVPPFFLKIVPEFAKLSLLKVKKKKKPQKIPTTSPFRYFKIVITYNFNLESIDIDSGEESL